MIVDSLTTSAGVTDALAALADRVRPSVVEIRSRHGHGSGTIWSDDGLIVTNHHVAPDDRARVVLADGRELVARAERRDSARDLAALRIDATGLPAAAIGDSGEVRVGHIVLAIGNPFGVPRAVTAGIISGPLAGGIGQLRWRDGIQAGIELRPGNSGGPLINVAGEVIAVNSLVIGPRLALSIPSAAVATLLATAGPTRLGIRVQPCGLPASVARTIYQDTGLLVTDIDDGSLADRSGILPGDILLSTTAPHAEGQSSALLEPGDLALAWRRDTRGDSLSFSVCRGGAVLELQISALAA